jgi:Coenzyme PQQ synthesis protein D (PqqD)
MQMQETVFRHSDSLVARDLAGEKVIIPVRGKVGDLGSIYTLNGVAGEIWNLLDGLRTAPEIVTALAQDYDVDTETLTADVQRTLAELAEEGLIVAAQGSQG